MTLSEIKRSLKALFKESGFDVSKSKWTLVTPDGVVVCRLEKSQFDAQCWFDVSVWCEGGEGDVASMVAFRLQNLFREYQMEIINSLVVGAEKESFARIENAFRDVFIPELKRMVSFSHLRELFESGKLNSLLIGWKLNQRLQG